MCTNQKILLLSPFPESAGLFSGQIFPLLTCVGDKPTFVRFSVTWHCYSIGFYGRSRQMQTFYLSDPSRVVVKCTMSTFSPGQLRTSAGGMTEFVSSRVPCYILTKTDFNICFNNFMDMISSVVDKFAPKRPLS